MTVVLTYKGSISHRQQAEAELRRAFPGVRLTQKSSTTIEAELAPEQVRNVQDSWVVTPLVYADINPPKLNLRRLRDKLTVTK